MLTQFDLASAVRVANVVRKVENDPPRTRPLTFGALLSDEARFYTQDGGGGGRFRIATFSGAWNKNEVKSVTPVYYTATEAISALNLFANIPQPNGSSHCAIAREGTAWYLIAAEC